jgi:hypothetical protein
LKQGETVGRRQTLIIVIYCAATVLLLTVAAGTLTLVEGRQRLQLVALLNSWFPGTVGVIGLLWLSSALAVSLLAYRLRARMLALAVAGSLLVTAALIYAWAKAIAFSGAGAGDVLKHVTVGGVYPLVAVLVIVGGLALLTLFRRAGARQTRAPFNRQKK